MADHLVWIGDCGAVSPHTVSAAEFPIGSTEECVFCEDDGCVATVCLKACADLIEFADGELDDARATAFVDHLADCTPCQVDLDFALQLEARLSMLR